MLWRRCACRVGILVFGRVLGRKRSLWLLVEAALAWGLLAWEIAGKPDRLQEPGNKAQNDPDQGRNRSRAQPAIQPKPDESRQRKTYRDGCDLCGPLDPHRQSRSRLRLKSHARLPPSRRRLGHREPRSPEACWLRQPKRPGLPSHDRRTSEAAEDVPRSVILGTIPVSTTQAPHLRNFSQSRRRRPSRLAMACKWLFGRLLSSTGAGVRFRL